MEAERAVRGERACGRRPRHGRGPRGPGRREVRRPRGVAERGGRAPALRWSQQRGAGTGVGWPAPPFEPDRETLDDLLRSLATLRAKTFASYGPKVEAGPLGLDKPAVTVRLTVQD